MRKDDTRVPLASPELDLRLAEVDQQQQFTGISEQLAPSLDFAMPITFTKDNRVHIHIGPKIEMITDHRQARNR